MNIKKFLSVVIAVVMVLGSLNITAFADGVVISEIQSITKENADSYTGNTYIVKSDFKDPDVADRFYPFNIEDNVTLKNVNFIFDGYQNPHGTGMFYIRTGCTLTLVNCSVTVKNIPDPSYQKIFATEDLNGTPTIVLDNTDVNIVGSGNVFHGLNVEIKNGSELNLENVETVFTVGAQDIAIDSSAVSVKDADALLANWEVVSDNFSFEATGTSEIILTNCENKMVAVKADDSVEAADAEKVVISKDVILDGIEVSDYSTSKTVKVATQDELNAAIKNAKKDYPTIIELEDGTYVPPMSTTVASMGGKDITFTGTKQVVLDYMSMQEGYVDNMIGVKITFEGVTVKWSNSNEGYQGLKNAEKAVYSDCTITGTQYMAGDADFINCLLYSTESNYGYNVYGRGEGTLNFDGCTFYTGGRAIMLYNDDPVNVTAIVKNCTFYDNGAYTSKPKSVVEIGINGNAKDKTSKFNVITENCKVEGFEANNSDSVLWGNKDHMSANDVSVTVDGEKVPTLAYIGDTGYFSVTDALYWAVENEKVDIVEKELSVTNTGAKVTENLDKDFLGIKEEDKAEISKLVSAAGAEELYKEEVKTTTDAIKDNPETLENTDVDIQLVYEIEPLTSVNNTVVYDINVYVEAKNADDEVLYTKPLNLKGTDVTLTLYTGMDEGTLVDIYHEGDADKVATATVDANKCVTFTTAKGFSNYYVKATGTANAVEQTSNIAVTFEKVTGKDNQYNINLKADDGKEIYRFGSADLTFSLTQGVNEFGEESDIKYTIEPGQYISIKNNKQNDNFNFYVNTSDDILGNDVSTLTGSVITLGTVTFTGYGEFNFKAVDAESKVNTALSAKFDENESHSHTVAGGDLILNTADIDVELQQQRAVMTIVVDYKNPVEKKDAEYTDMKLTITGDKNYVYTIDLGSDAVPTGVFQSVEWAEKTTPATETEKANRDTSYTIKVSLPIKTEYKITLEGDGYRTATQFYTLKDINNAPVTFWNNVDGAGKTSFLAGDIVKDNKINIYDLSAVVSYFKADVVTAENGYNQYDLNRDGQINTKDINWLLQSWDK